MKNQKHPTSTNKKKISPRIKLLRAQRIAAYLSLALIALSAFRGDLWLFIPAAVALLGFYWGSFGALLSGLGFFIGLIVHQQSGLLSEALHQLVWLFIFGLGFCLAFMRRMRHLMPALCWSAVLFTLFGGLILLQKSGSLSPEELSLWMERQLLSSDPEVLSRNPQLAENFEFQKSFLSLAGFSLIGMVLSGLALFNLLILRFLDRSLKWRWRAPAYWKHFSEWRTSEWVLLPLALGLVGLALQYQTALDFELGLSSWLLWNMSLLSLFPLALSGLAFFVWLIPRVSMLLGIILLVVLFFNAYAVLIAGFGDVWFNFRKEIRDFQRRQRDKERDRDDDEGLF